MTDEKWLASLPVNTIFRITIQMVGSEYRDRMAVVRGFTRYKPRMPFEWYHIPYDKKRRKYRQLLKSWYSLPRSGDVVLTNGQNQYRMTVRQLREECPEPEIPTGSDAEWADRIAVLEPPSPADLRRVQVRDS